MGYHRAGFEVTGVDIKPQPRYPFAFIEADALDYLRAHGHEYDVIHASPPCQAHSSLTKLTSTREHKDLIPETRNALIASGKPYVIENVAGAPLISPFMLCGTMFGLKVARHRLFESNMFFMTPGTCDHSGDLVTVLTKSCRRIGDMRGPSCHEKGKEAMGIDWMTQFELGLAIPPAYTEWIGEQIMKCPFCNEDDFDDIGLKGHLENEDCEEYRNIPKIRRMFKEADENTEAVGCSRKVL